MELRSAEEELRESVEMYETLRRTLTLGRVDDNSQDSDKWRNLLRTTLPPIGDDNNGVCGEEEEGKESEESSTGTVSGVLKALEDLQRRAERMKEKADKFRKRSQQKDPITNAPRYGENTMARVQSFLASYSEFVRALAIVAGGEESAEGGGDGPRDHDHDHARATEASSVDTGDGKDGNTSSTHSNSTSTSPSHRNRPIMDEIRDHAQREQQSAQRMAWDEERRRDEEERTTRLDEERRRMEALAQAEEAERQRRREQEELAARAEASRQARREAERRRLEEDARAREAQRQADQAWMAEIDVGPAGVRTHLVRLLASTQHDSVARRIALSSLRILFSQIVANPEEIKFRRVKRDHEQFNQDIGRHQGGKEILIAAGFRLGAIDDVPCFLCSEPNIETEMEAWSEWFDLLKNTLQIIEEELRK